MTAGVLIERTAERPQPGDDATYATSRRYELAEAFWTALAAGEKMVFA